MFDFASVQRVREARQENGIVSHLVAIDKKTPGCIDLWPVFKFRSTANHYLLIVNKHY